MRPLLLGADTNLRDNGAPLFGVGTNAFRHRAGLSGFRLHALGVKRFLCVARAQNAIELGIEARNDRRCCPCRRHQRYPQNSLVAREAGSAMVDTSGSTGTRSLPLVATARN